MATDLIKSLRERQDALRDELLEDPRFQEYDLVTQLLARHEASVVLTEVSAGPVVPRKLADRSRAAVLASITAPASTPIEAPTRGHVGRAPTERTPFQRTATGMAAVVEASADYLRRKGSRAGSAELHSELVKRRILHPGADDRSKVTSYLGRKKELFDNVRGEGYGLREWASEITA